MEHLPSRRIVTDWNLSEQKDWKYASKTAGTTKHQHNTIFDTNTSKLRNVKHQFLVLVKSAALLCLCFVQHSKYCNTFYQNFLSSQDYFIMCMVLACTSPPKQTAWMAATCAKGQTTRCAAAALYLCHSQSHCNSENMGMAASSLAQQPESATKETFIFFMEKEAITIIYKNIIFS